MNVFYFSEHVGQIQRDGIVLALRKAGFSASREVNTLRTNATRAQIALAWGHGLSIQSDIQD